MIMRIYFAKIYLIFMTSLEVDSTFSGNFFQCLDQNHYSADSQLASRANSKAHHEDDLHFKPAQNISLGFCLKISV